MTKYLFAFLATAILTTTGISQYKFEGHNIILDVPTTQKMATCAVRYAPPQSRISVAGLSPGAAVKLKACQGSGTNLVQNSPTQSSVNANASTYKWCFEGDQKIYRITFNGDEFSGPITYNWIAEPDPRDAGYYNIRDFGAVGDGRTDDTIAIRSAMAYIASKNGGTLAFPEGDYLVTQTIALPSGIIIHGTNGLASKSPTSHLPRANPTRIRLAGSNRALFRIGECTEKITIRDIELIADSNENTFGIEAVGAYNSSQDFMFQRVVFNNFFRGINAYGLPQTDLSWQFDYVKVDECRFIFNRDAGIFTNSRNSDWRVKGSVFINPPRQPGQNANSMHFERAAGILIQDTFGGGFPGALGGTFLNILDSGGINIVSSQTEAMTYSLVYNAVENPSAGDYSYPIVMSNSAFGNPIVFKARRTLVSNGNFFNGDTFRADKWLRVYSTGDRFCYDGIILGCRGADMKNFDGATVIFMTGQPGEGRIEGHPTYFGTDVRFGAPVQMQSVLHNALGRVPANGTMVYCSNCRRSTTPCQPGGSGAPAMVVNGQWGCL
jgi:hypothetical protein